MELQDIINAKFYQLKTNVSTLILTGFYNLIIKEKIIINDNNNNILIPFLFHFFYYEVYVTSSSSECYNLQLTFQMPYQYIAKK